MEKTYTQDEAQTIGQMVDGLIRPVVADLVLNGWSVNTDFDSGLWFMKGTSQDDDQTFSLTVYADGITASFSGSVPVTVRLLGTALMKLVGPYITANNEW